jgi:hypothetical protein
MPVNLDIEAIKRAVLGTKYGSFSDLPFDYSFDSSLRGLQDQQGSFLQNLGVQQQRAAENFDIYKQALDRSRDQNISSLSERLANNGTYRSSITGEQTGNILQNYGTQLENANLGYNRQQQDFSMSQADFENAIARQLESLSHNYATNVASTEAQRAAEAAKAITTPASYAATPTSSIPAPQSSVAPPAVNPTTGAANDIEWPWGDGARPGSLDEEVKAFGITPNQGEYVTGRTIVNGKPIYVTNIGGVYAPQGGFAGNYLGLDASQKLGDRTFTGIQGNANGGYSLISDKTGQGEGTYDFNPTPVGTAANPTLGGQNNFGPAAARKLNGLV